MSNLITSSVIAGPSFRDELPRHEGFREEAEQVRAEAGCCRFILQHIQHLNSFNSTFNNITRQLVNLAH